MSPNPTNPASAAAANPSAVPDTQTVIGLLGSLMPLLLQMQSQPRDYMLQTGPLQSAPYQPGFAPPDPSGLADHLGHLPPANAMLDHQAATNLVEDITADALRTLSTYLETYAGQHRGLDGCVQIVAQAARCFAARDYAQAFGLIWQAYRVITALRVGNPQLPPPRAAGLAGTSFPSSTAAVH